MAWHALAAEQGDAGAQLNVGACYCNGRHGAVQADKVAREWWVKAGVQGDENARKGLRILDAATGKAAQASFLVPPVTCTGKDVRCIVDDSLDMLVYCSSWQ
jgi:TPR repeat protein